MKKFLTAIMILLSLASFASVNSYFSSSAIKGCSPLVINLTDHSTGNVNSIHWNLGNGNTSTQTNPSATYIVPGVYKVTLIVSDGITSDSSAQTITVFSPPSVDFIVDRTAACPEDSLQFTNLVTPGSAPVSQYAWGFGNGIASSDINAAYRYPVSGTYDVTLVVQDTNGCDGHLTKPSYITVWPKPTAAFTASPLLSCAASQVVDFSSQSTGTGLTYTWYFGDSAIGTGANPSHLYSYGIYNANVIVANNYGCIDSMHKTISVIDVQANFIALKTTVCAGETVNFLNQSPMGNSWHWSFGDGSTSNKANPGKSYTQPGVYSITFTVSDNVCHDSATRTAYITVTQGFAVGFTADNQNSCTTPFVVNFTSTAPSGTSLTWTFGDGNTSNAANPTNTYNNSSVYAVSLTAVDSSGCSVTATLPGFINTSKPAVSFLTLDTLFCPGARVQFYNNTQNATRYLWNFGDGTTSTLYQPAHIFSSMGNFTISLTAWDTIGCDSTLVKASLIHIDTPQVHFNVDERFSMCPPLVSVFSSVANNPDLKYLWNFGDGYTDTVPDPTHIYFHPGVYTVTLTATSKYGCSNTVTDTNLIVVQGPSATFTMNPNSGCIPVDVSFSAQPSANTQTIVCDLGDGTLYTDSLNFHYTYRTVNVFHPKFILTDQIGCSVAYTLDSIVTHPEPILNLRDTAICSGQQVQVTLGSDQYLWRVRNMDDCDTCLKSLHNCDTCNTVVLHPEDSSVYVVTATNQFGCSTTGSFKVMVVPMPILNAQDTIKLCKNGSVKMDVVQQAYVVTWSPSTYLSSNTASAPTCTPAQNIDYTLTAYNQLGCTISQRVPVRVYDQIPLTVSADTAVCAGVAVQLHAAVTDTFFHGVTYTWLPSAYLSSTDIADPVATIQSQSETFQVTATSGVCPAATATVTIAVHAPASVKLPAQIVTTQYAEQSIAPVSGDLVTYLWSAKDTLSCTECATTTIVPRESQVVYLEGANQYGCTTRDSMMIQILGCDPATIFVPNTFTPNGDGTNDKLYVRSRTLAQLEYFRLFNRWGAIVYESKNMSDGWDGSVNGKLAEQGVYVYQVSGKCESGYDIATSGTVTLIR